MEQPDEPLDGSSRCPLVTRVRTASVETAQPRLGSMEPNTVHGQRTLNCPFRDTDSKGERGHPQAQRRKEGARE